MKIRNKWVGAFRRNGNNVRDGFLAGALALLPAMMVLACVGAAEAQPTDAEPSGGPGSAALVRELSLGDLGFGAGLSFAHLSGKADVYFPLASPGAVEGARLVLDLEHADAGDSERFLQVIVGERVTRSIDLTGLPSPARIEMPIDATRASGGFLRVGFAYFGAMTDRVCFDERAAGDYLGIAPDSHIRLEVDADALDTPALVAAFQPRRMAIRLPDEQTPEITAAALRLAAMFGGEKGLVTYGDESAEPAPEWRMARVGVEGASDVEGFSAMVGRGEIGGRPAILVSGPDPQLALAMVNSEWSGLSGPDGLRTDGAAAPRRPVEAIGFGALGFDLRAKPVANSTTFDFAFDIADLPSGTRPNAVTLMIAAAPDPDGKGVTAVISLNETALGSAALEGGAPTRLTFDVPDGLVGRNNLLRVEILRQPRGGECIFAPQGYPAQVLPTSRLELTATDGRIDDFFELRQAMRGQVDLMIDPAVGADRGTLLGWLGPLVAGMVPGTTDIRPVASLDGDDASATFVTVSDMPPSGTDPRLQFAGGVAELRSSDGELLFAGADLAALGTAHIVTVGGRQGLWLRPGAGDPPRPTEQRPLVLDRGDVAFIGADGVLVAMPTGLRGSVTTASPIGADLPGIVDRYRPWIVGALSMIVLLVVLAAVGRIVAARASARKA